VIGILAKSVFVETPEMVLTSKARDTVPVEYQTQEPKTPMSNLNELLARRAALEEEIKALSEAQRGEGIEKVKALMHEYGLSVADLAGSPRVITKSATKPASKVAAKYRDQDGNAWSGRGLQPKWLKAAIAGGKKIEDFAV
jgi:DNA-binding protein H-NS